MSRKIQIPFGEWMALDQSQARILASAQDTGPLWLRIHFAAIGYANLIGHAEFENLALILQRVNPQTGEFRIPGVRDVRKAVGEATSRGLLAPESSRQCLVVPARLAAKTGGRKFNTTYCKHHSIQAIAKASNL